MGIIITTGIRLNPGIDGPLSDPMGRYPLRYFAQHSAMTLAFGPFRPNYDLPGNVNLIWSSEFIIDIAYWTALSTMIEILERLPLQPAYVDLQCWRGRANRELFYVGTWKPTVKLGLPMREPDIPERTITRRITFP